MKFIVLLLLFVLTHNNKIIFNRNSRYENNYTLPIEVGNQKLNLVVFLSNEINWIKMEDCTSCAVDDEADDEENKQ